MRQYNLWVCCGFAYPQTYNIESQICPATSQSYRWQMGMRVPEPAGSCRLQIGDDVVVWEEGATLAFDDRTEHEAWNDADEPRYVLFVQVPWPVTGFARVTHRATHRLFATATRRIPKHAASLDRTLNPRR